MGDESKAAQSRTVAFRVPMDIDWSEGEWITCPIEGYRHLTFKLRYPDQYKTDEIDKLTTKIIIDGGKRVEEPDDSASAEELFVYVLEDCTGAICNDGSNYKWDKEGKLVFMRKHRLSARWVVETACAGIEIARVKQERLDKEKKISASGSSAEPSS